MTGMKHKEISGVIVPMVTPVNDQGTVDVFAIKKILDTFLEAGVSVFILGTTGESVSLSNEQKELLVEAVCSHLNGNLPVYAGVSGNSFHESVQNAHRYTGLGVNAVVAHLPFYYPVSPHQMLRYFEQLADHIDVPLILYNNPATVRESIPVNIINRLSHHSNIIGIKDSERETERLEQSLELWKNRDDFVHLLGWTAKSVYALGRGSAGLVPSTGNLTPGMYRELFDATRQGRIKEAELLQGITDRITEIYQKGRNLSGSIPALKSMMAGMGLCSPHVLPPLIDLSGDEEAELTRAYLAELKNYQLKTG